jgi:hypothetical protein
MDQAQKQKKANQMLTMMMMILDTTLRDMYQLMRK